MFLIVWLAWRIRKYNCFNILVTVLIKSILHRLSLFDFFRLRRKSNKIWQQLSNTSLLCTEIYSWKQKLSSWKGKLRKEQELIYKIQKIVDLLTNREQNQYMILPNQKICIEANTQKAKSPYKIQKLVRQII